MSDADIEATGVSAISIEQAYAACEAIARREAKNFYYAFLALPSQKRAAICAVYAFMRHADDLADDVRVPAEERLRQTECWIEQWHRAAEGGVTGNAVFIALRDAQRRYRIPPELLDQLVQGTMLDLTDAEANAGADGLPADVTAGGRRFAVYRTFDDLYRYCYLVASVVGLVCIRIFGYSDARAEQLAEQTGIAFQLTNILRDVREDAERGRVYLPLEDLTEFHVSVEELASTRANRQLTPVERELMAREVRRAREYYAAADALLPLIAPDSRAALWVLVTIYRRLLDRIEDAQFEVFSAKIKVPLFEKLLILGRGLWMSLRLRSASKS